MISNSNHHSIQENILCTHPNFIKNYFINSRLHHLSTWKVELSEYIISLMNNSSQNPDNIDKNLNQLNSSSYSQNKAIRNKKFIASKSTCKYRTIMHIDMDCFFASVGIRDRLDLQDKPIAVAHSINGLSLNYSTSEIASCNYHARSKGIKNGMVIGKAKLLEPNLIIIPYEFDKYDECSKSLYRCLVKYADYVQAVSCDEAYIDVTYYIQSQLKNYPNNYNKDDNSNNYNQYNNINSKGIGRYFDEDNEDDDDNNDIEILTNRKIFQSNEIEIKLKYEELIINLAKDIKKDIYTSTKGCNASIGISYNMLLARLATIKAKPNGIYKLLEHDKIANDLYNLPISQLPGIGYAINDKCKSMSWKTCGDLLVINKDIIQQTVGLKTGEMLLEYAQGIDSRILENHERKSIGVDINWGIRFNVQSELDEFMKQLCHEVYNRLIDTNYYAKHIILTIKKKLYDGEPEKFLGCGHCLDINKSITPLLIIDNYHILYENIMILYKDIMKTLYVTDVRGIGIHLKNLIKNNKINEINNHYFMNNNIYKSIDKEVKSSKFVDNIQIKSIDDKQIDSINLNNYHGNDITSNDQQMNDMNNDNIINNDNKNNSNTDNTKISIHDNISNLPRDIDIEVFQSLPINIQNEIINNTKHGYTYNIVSSPTETINSTNTNGMNSNKKKQNQIDINMNPSNTITLKRKLTTTTIISNKNKNIKNKQQNDLTKWLKVL